MTTSQDGETARAAIRPLPILAIVTAAYNLLLSQPRAWLLALLIPLLIEVAATGGFLALYGDLLGGGAINPALAQSGAFYARTAGLILCSMIAYVLFAVSWHRFVLLGPAERPRLLPAVQRRHTRFAIMSFAVIGQVFLALLIPLILLVVANVQSVIATLLVLTVTVALFVRWQLIFPAIAVDRQLLMAESWQLTRGNGIRLFWGFVLATLPWTLVTLVLTDLTQPLQDRFMRTGEQPVGAIAAMLAGSLLSYASLAVIVGVLSGAYRHLVLAAEQPAALPKALPSG